MRQQLFKGIRVGSGVGLMLWSLHSARAELKIIEVGAAITSDGIELRGMSAGQFNAQYWKSDTLHWLPDARTPMLQPRDGRYRNIYAPSVVARANYWDLFYGGWDGVPTPNDRIYHTTTTDFLQFGDRSNVIQHGEFEHVCNVSAVASGDKGFELLCTAFPDAKGQNKPAHFSSMDGVHWNGSAAPYSARQSDIVSLSGYADYAGADINGMNVLFRDDNAWCMYFADFHHLGTIWRATSSDATHFAVDGSALKFAAAPNDVKRFGTGVGDATYVMVMHMNCSQTWYALASDGIHFGGIHKLISSAGDADKYIVAVGLVTSKMGLARSRVHGLLYGAGSKSTLDENRIFARWLQKRVVIECGGKYLEPRLAHGPDRQLLDPSSASLAHCTLRLYEEDGLTLIAVAEGELEYGHAYALGILNN